MKFLTQFFLTFNNCSTKETPIPCTRSSVSKTGVVRSQFSRLLLYTDMGPSYRRSASV
jgi:hypothetical protein